MSIRNIYWLLLAGIVAFWTFVAALVVEVANAGERPRSMRIEWSYPDDVSDLAGFKIYLRGASIDIPDPKARSGDWTFNLDDGSNDFTMTAYDSAGGESTPSSPYNVDPRPGSVTIQVVRPTGQ